MNRRDMMTGGLALAAAAGVSAQAETGQGAAAGPQREFYLIRKYSMNRGLQSTSVSKYFQEALMPALARMGLGPVGVMTLTYGSGSPMMVAVIPAKDAQTLSTLAKAGQISRETAVKSLADTYDIQDVGAELERIREDGAGDGGEKAESVHDLDVDAG